MISLLPVLGAPLPSPDESLSCSSLRDLEKGLICPGGDGRGGRGTEEGDRTEREGNRLQGQTRMGRAGVRWDPRDQPRGIFMTMPS